MSARGRAVVFQEADGRDGHLAAFEFVSKLLVDMPPARLTALSLADAGC